MNDKTSLLPWILSTIMALAAVYLDQHGIAAVGVIFLLWLKLADMCIEDEERNR